MEAPKSETVMKLVLKISPCPDSSYAAWCPALPDCAVRAATKEQAEQRIKEAVTGYLCSLDAALPRELDRRLRIEAESITAA